MSTIQWLSQATSQYMSHCGYKMPTCKYKSRRKKKYKNGEAWNDLFSFTTPLQNTRKSRIKEPYITTTLTFFIFVSEPKMQLEFSTSYQRNLELFSSLICSE